MSRDEKALRTPGFSEGCRVALADGQEWVLPKPRIRFKPRIVDGKVEIGGGPAFGPEFDDKLDILLGVAEADLQEVLESSHDLSDEGRSDRCTIDSERSNSRLRSCESGSKQFDRLGSKCRIFAGIGKNSLGDRYFSRVL